MTQTAINSTSFVQTVGTLGTANVIHWWDGMPMCHFTRRPYKVVEGKTWEVAIGDTVTGRLCRHCFNKMTPLPLVSA